MNNSITPQASIQLAQIDDPADDPWFTCENAFDAFYILVDVMIVVCAEAAMFPLPGLVQACLALVAAVAAAAVTLCLTCGCP